MAAVASGWTFTHDKFFDAIGNGDFSSVDKLLKREVALRPPLHRAVHPFFGETALFQAAKVGAVDIAARLIEAGATVNQQRPKYKDTPLHACAMHGHAKVARLLIEAGANRSLRNALSRKPLDIAVERKHENVVQILLEPPGTPGTPKLDGLDEDGNVKIVWERATSIGAKIAKYRVEICLWGLDNGPDVQETSIDVAGKCHAHTLRDLIPGRDYGVRVSARNISGWGVPSEWLTFRSSSTVPAAVKCLQITSVGATSVKLQWDPPQDNGKCISEYRIRVRVAFEKGFGEQDTREMILTPDERFCADIDAKIAILQNEVEEVQRAKSKATIILKPLRYEVKRSREGIDARVVKLGELQESLECNRAELRALSKQGSSSKDFDRAYAQLKVRDSQLGDAENIIYKSSTCFFSTFNSKGNH